MGRRAPAPHKMHAGRSMVTSGNIPASWSAARQAACVACSLAPSCSPFLHGKVSVRLTPTARWTWGNRLARRLPARPVLWAQDRRASRPGERTGQGDTSHLLGHAGMDRDVSAWRARWRGTAFKSRCPPPSALRPVSLKTLSGVSRLDAGKPNCRRQSWPQPCLARPDPAAPTGSSTTRLQRAQRQVAERIAAALTPLRSQRSWDPRTPRRR